MHEQSDFYYTTDGGRNTVLLICAAHGCNSYVMMSKHRLFVYFDHIEYGLKLIPEGNIQPQRWMGVGVFIRKDFR
jgi:hypothetical protein